MNTPLVTVLLPVYNGEHFLPYSIESVLSQTLMDFELLIINDGSTDKTLEIIKTYEDPRIRIINQKNLGLARTLHNGVLQAKGIYIARMDADDISLPNRLSIQTIQMEQNPEVVLCHGLVDLIDSNGHLLQKRVGLPLTSWQARWSLLWRNVIIHPTVFLRKNFLINRGFNYNPFMVGCEDYELWRKLADKAAFSFLNSSLVRYRLHRESITHKDNLGDNLHFTHFSNIIKENVYRYTNFFLTDIQCKELAMLSGQTRMHLRETYYQNRANFFIHLNETVTENFIAKHKLMNKEICQVRKAVVHQYVHWALNAWPSKKGLFLNFILASLVRAPICSIYLIFKQARQVLREKRIIQNRFSQRLSP